MSYRDTLPSPPPRRNARGSWPVLLALGALWAVSMVALFWVLDPRFGASHDDERARDRSVPTDVAPVPLHHHARGGALEVPWPTHARHRS